MSYPGTGIKSLAGHRILVEVDMIEEKTAGGIVIPSQTRERDQLSTNTGTLIGVGPDAWSDKRGPWAQVGDKVLFPKLTGLRWIGKKDGKEYRLLNDLDIIVSLEEESNE